MGKALALTDALNYRIWSHQIALGCKKDTNKSSSMINHENKSTGQRSPNIVEYSHSCVGEFKSEDWTSCQDKTSDFNF